MTTDTKTPTTTEEVTLAPVIEALTNGYRQLAEHCLKTEGVTLPKVLVTVARDESRKGGVKLGHITTSEAWHAGSDGFLELMVTGQGLSRGAVAVFGTLAHETSHAFNIAKGIKDTDSNGRHNKKFAKTAEEVFGLTITEVGSIGWSHTEVGEACQGQWAHIIAEIENALSVSSLGLKTEPKKKGRDKNNAKAVCECGGVIRASRKVLEACRPWCQNCETEFTIEGEED